MNKLFFSILTLISLGVVAQDNTMVNDANAQKRTLTAGFTGIKVSDGIDLYLNQGNEESVAVSASEEKYREKLKSEVVDGVLRIYYDNKGLNWSNEKKQLKAYVSFKSLNKLHASEGADVLLSGSMDITELEMSFTSGAHFKGKINGGSLTVDQNSGSNIEVSGNATKLKVGVSSGAMFKGYDLTTEFCEAKASSGGGVRITIARELSAKANSGGGIKYKGEGIIKNVNISSGGSVKKG